MLFHAYEHRSRGLPSRGTLTDIFEKYNDQLSGVLLISQRNVESHKIVRVQHMPIARCINGP